MNGARTLAILRALRAQGDRQTRARFRVPEVSAPVRIGGHILQTRGWDFAETAIFPSLAARSSGQASPSSDAALEQEADSVADRVLRMAAPAAPALDRPGGGGVGKASAARPARITASPEAQVPGSGQRLDPDTREFFERRFAYDFSGVRVHADEAAGERARKLHAKAFASGEDLVFGRDEYAPKTAKGRRLLAHELTHVVQQGRSQPGPEATRRFTGGSGAAIGVRTAPGLTISRQAAVGAPFSDPLAWSSAAEAAKAMRAYQALAPAARKQAVADSYQHDLIRVLAVLSPVDKTKTFVDSIREITRWVEELETRSSAKMTDDQIAGEQATFLIKQATDDANAAAAAAAAKSKAPVVPPTPAQIETARKTTVAANSSVTPPVVGWWAGLSPAQKIAWTNRGNAAIAKVVTLAGAKYPELGTTAANFNLDFEETEKRGGNVVAAGSPALVGKTFVETAELNPAYVIDVVVHEVFGHPEYGPYGTEYHLALYDKAATKIPGYVAPDTSKPAGIVERRLELDSYAYQETEIYAVLRSMPFRTAPSAADVANVPNLDTQDLVTSHVKSMKKQWSPKLIVAIMRGLLKRLLIDPRIGAPAINVFLTAVTTNFDAATAAAIFK
jgi:Domain of unknown function (DUF4157)